MAKVGVDITQNEYYQNNGNSPTNENWGTYQYMLLEQKQQKATMRSAKGGNNTAKHRR